MKTNSNSYTIIYSVIIVVIVAFLLAFVSSSLKATQDANVALDTQKQILNSLNLRDLDNATAAAKYKEVVKHEGEKDGMKYYECEIDGQKKTVYSVRVEVSGAAFQASSPWMLTTTPSMAYISTTKARQPDSVLKSRTT